MIIKEINLLSNEKLQKKLQIVSIPLFLILFILFWMISNIESPYKRLVVHDINEIFLSTIILVSIFLLHELIHAVLFKMFCPSSTIKFGFKKGIIYTESLDSEYSVKKFIVSCVTPFIIISLLLFCLNFVNILTDNLFILIATLHGISCIGDFYWIYILRKYDNRKYKVVPTKKGINIVY
ncbi:MULTISPECIES: DUF3267 domain-containing protein [Bacillus cereus group]|uniref:CerR1 protein n=2 Tax=Bacillus cereus TaxID=1396 RepID=E5AK71_BACCE|nr:MULTISPECIES: DUF3267 domain-containing protein [Bacillus cereus group]CBW44211.1 CerR1 protein [Bacillus cereus VPC1401]AKR13171.1 hypothetical protein AC241_31450 [Bacillus thuringiensis]MDZ4588755.1 DUF3267 domain-containing protein [Bacillus cereus]MDZ4599602.1 DUF3267 domain-containing protein [Bacillus cereus]WPA86291.1 DUF3267 domain-containing protein [Bacillus cereus]